MLRGFPALLQEHQNMLSLFCQIRSFYFLCSRFVFSQFEFRKADIFQHISKICFAQDQFRLFFFSGLHRKMIKIRENISVGKSVGCDDTVASLFQISFQYTVFPRKIAQTQGCIHSVFQFSHGPVLEILPYRTVS